MSGMRSDAPRALWCLYAGPGRTEPTIEVERPDNTAKRENNPISGANNTVECICCASTDAVKDVVIGWNNYKEADAKGYAHIEGVTRNAMCKGCRKRLRHALRETK